MRTEDQLPRPAGDLRHQTLPIAGASAAAAMPFGLLRAQAYPSRRRPSVPTAHELGYGVVSTSPYRLVGPKGRDPAVERLGLSAKT